MREFEKALSHTMFSRSPNTVQFIVPLNTRIAAIEMKVDGITTSENIYIC